MAAITLLLIVLVHVAAAQQIRMTIDPVVLPGDGTGRCSSKMEREKARLFIRNKVESALTNASVIPECGDGLWYQVAYLNMTDPTQQCPSAWRLYNANGVRACGRPVTSGQSCPATFYPTGRQFSKVCGRIIGYQVATPGAFHVVYTNPLPRSLDDTYVDGVSVTHGYPRSHIWTFAAGVTEGRYIGGPAPDCPCSRVGATQAPSYVGNNYYCESGNSATRGILNHLYSSDALWDGQQCEGQCCSNGKSPPWFSVELPSTTTDAIEVRICGDESTSNEDTPIKLIELYIGSD